MPITAEPDDRTPLAVPQLLCGMRAAADQFEAFILDLWGVIHDGHSAFPHSAETLRHLKARGRKTILLSNAPRRGHALVTQMANMGIPRDLYGEVMSSGEAVRTELIERSDPFFAGLGEKCYHLGPERDLSVFEDVPVARVPLDEADFVVNTGPFEMTDGLDDYRDLLTRMRDRDLPMVCANPDKVVIRQGKPIMCAGALAEEYVEMGGRVGWRGKPDAAIYRLCIRTLGVDPHRVAVVGDALETDMRGAADAGLSGIWVTGGIHAKEVDGGYGKPGDPLRIASLAAEYDVAPTAVLPGFIW